MQSRSESALNRDKAAFEHLLADMAKCDMAATNIVARRDKDTLRWMIGLFMAAIANLVTLLGS